MEFLYFLENLRTGIGNVFFSLITMFGEEVLFLVFALILFWCVDKKKAYYIMICGFVASLAGQFLKLLCKIPRPWVRDPRFTIVGNAKEAATGYSFPSGHTLIVTSTWGATALAYTKRILRIAAISLIILVGFSRMYLGVHTPWDVLAGWGIGLVTVIGLYPLMKKAAVDSRVMWAVIAGLALLAAGNLLYATLTVPTNPPEGPLDEALKNAWTFLGLTAGLAVAYLLDCKVTHFDTQAVWWAQALKVAGGLAILLLIRTLLKAPLLSLTGGHHLADGIRYCLMVIVGGGLWPMTFPFFAKLGKPKNETH